MLLARRAGELEEDVLEIAFGRRHVEDRQPAGLNCGQDPADRRRVIVTLNPEAGRDAAPLFAEWVDAVTVTSGEALENVVDKEKVVAPVRPA